LLPRRRPQVGQRFLHLRAFGRNEKTGLFSGISVISSERSKKLDSSGRLIALKSAKG